MDSQVKATTGKVSNSTDFPSIYVPFCAQIQTYSIKDVITVWDLAFLIPNSIFLCFLIYKWVKARHRLKSLNLPILTVFYYMIFTVTVLSIFRVLVSFILKPSTKIGEITNKLVWLMARMGQLATELSVLLFGLFFGRLESRKSILRVMYCTVPISLLYITVQAFLEIFYPDKHYIVIDSSNHYYDLYGQGGMLFWFISSITFAILYSVIFILPLTPLKNNIVLPTKKSFYVYCLLLAITCIAQSLGSMQIYSNRGDYGMCIVSITTYVYFTLHGPLVYIVFLRKFFHNTTPFQRYYIDANNSVNRSINSAGSVTGSINQIFNSMPQHISSQNSTSSENLNNSTREQRESPTEYNQYYPNEDDDSHKIIIHNSNLI